MKVLIIGAKARYEKFMPSMDYVNSVEQVYVTKETPIEEMLAAASDADAIFADAIAKVPAELINQMPNLRLIHSEGVAYNGIDLAAASAKGVIVCNNKGINDTAVAEQAVMLMLGLLRTVLEGDREVRAGRQIQMKERRMLEGITELADCKVGLVGFGDIGKATSRLLNAFGCEVYYNDYIRQPEAKEKEYGVTYLPLEELVAASDIVSIHVPVTPATTGMVNREFLQRMKPTAYLINTARGEIVDNEALAQALTEGWIAGAGLDVVAPEPVPADHMLLHLPEAAACKVLFAPHLGGITTSTFRRAHRNLWTALKALEMGEVPAHKVN